MLHFHWNQSLKRGWKWGCILGLQTRVWQLAAMGAKWSYDGDWRLQPYSSQLEQTAWPAQQRDKHREGLSRSGGSFHMSRCPRRLTLAPQHPLPISWEQSVPPDLLTSAPKPCHGAAISVPNRLAPTGDPRDEGDGRLGTARN